VVAVLTSNHGHTTGEPVNLKMKIPMQSGLVPQHTNRPVVSVLDKFHPQFLVVVAIMSSYCHGYVSLQYFSLMIYRNSIFQGGCDYGIKL